MTDFTERDGLKLSTMVALSGRVTGLMMALMIVIRTQPPPVKQTAEQAELYDLIRRAIQAGIDETETEIQRLKGSQ